ncbi:MAG: aminoacyl-tRNA hydrolase [Gemmatimonadales bacterium]|nr:MAG: aminoacyl-tRNA hydrolase [Gemmatimonadales bacterium]
MEPGAGDGRLRVVAGLGNPGPRYDATRHNVGWWMADRLAHDWGLGGFRKEGAAQVARGQVAGGPIVVLKPLTYMNRSGGALLPFLGEEGFVVPEQLLVLVDDISLSAGRARFRPSGSAGGHNGLKSVEAVLGHREYPRLRIGVGTVPPGVSLVDWVLSPMEAEDEDRVLERLPELVEGVELWITDGIEAAMNRHNG